MAHKIKIVYTLIEQRIHRKVVIQKDYHHILINVILYWHTLIVYTVISYLALCPGLGVKREQRIALNDTIIAVIFGTVVQSRFLAYSCVKTRGSMINAALQRGA